MKYCQKKILNFVFVFLFSLSRPEKGQRYSGTDKLLTSNF